ncbi:MAG: caspase family protein [Elusimicrobia bacterium]|nr:caspase family protein [Elusimicrobiota bacterium]
MRLSSRCLPRLAALLACACVLSSCVANPVNLRYAPDALATPWEGSKPKLFLASVTDRSEGFKWVGVQSVSKPVVRPLEESLREALVNEFGRLGITLVKVPKDADAQVSASWLQASVGLKAGVAVTDDGTVKMMISVRGRNNISIWSDVVIVGHGKGTHRHWGCCPGIGPEQAINAALADAMKKLEEAILSQDLAGQIFAANAQAATAQAPAQLPAVRSDVDEVPSVKPARRKAHAVVIGIENYRQQLPSVDFASSDARLVAKYLTRVLGYPEENVAVLTNDGVSRSDIEKYIERWLPNRVEAGDEVLIYYSGHGAPNPATGDAYLVPYDGDPMYLEQTGYPLDRLYAQLAKLPSKEVTVVLDSCFSGAGGRSVIAKGARPLVNVAGKQAVPNNVRVLSAAAGNQISQSYQEMGHGLFTYFFLKGIGRQVQKGEVNLRQAFDFAAPQVSQTARREYNTDQVPQWQEGR